MVQRLEIILFRSVKRRSDQEWSVVWDSENTPSCDGSLELRLVLFGVLIVYTQKHRARRKCSYVESSRIFRSVEGSRIRTGTSEQQRAPTERMFQKILVVEPK